MPRGRQAILALLIFGLSATGLPGTIAHALAEPEEGIAFFEKSIRPVLVKHCYECHSADAASRGKLKAGLLLDTRQGLLTGGESGPAIVAGDPKKSLLLAALRYESYEMPPTGRLPPEVIEQFGKWISMGAPDPREGTTAPVPRRAAFKISDEDRAHWAFQPMRDPPLPTVADAAWVRDELDRFVLARLEQAGQRPNAEADRHALLRRASYALIGLPPSANELAAFAADDSPDAFEKVVDRLLDSPEFGVHWGRHWLDGVRYADDVDKSGEYRRFVIRAFNQDLPYDEFVRLQIAGDLIPAADKNPNSMHASGAALDGIAATGMMALAVWEQVGRDLAVAEIVDSQIDLVGRQLLGLTLACARCHDHKFDPISTDDYYALAGIFFSSHIATGKLIADDRLGNDLIATPLLSAADQAFNRKIDEEIAYIESRIIPRKKLVPQAARLAAIRTELKELETQLAAKNASNKKSLTDQAEKLRKEEKELLADQQAKKWDANPPELAEISAMRLEVAERRKRKLSAATAVAIVEGGVPGSNREKIGDAPIYVRGEYQHPGAIVPRRFPIILAGDKQTPIGERTKHSGRRELAEWITASEHPLTARVMVNRVWQQLIGRGLVRTTDNFGRLGEKPTHPELLDYLSRRFVASHWSVKRLVREIVLSATFRQSSVVSPGIASADPDNKLIGRMNRRRLTYEELRDSLLLLGGTLAPGDPANGNGATNKGLEYRTIYEPLERKKVNVTAAIFDGPDPKAIVPMRAETTTAPQALFLMNHPLVADAAKRLADRLTKDASLKTDEERLERLWQTVVSRPPDADELTVARGFVAKYSLARFVHALLATNEFAYVD